jgi:ribosomal protein L13
MDMSTVFAKANEVRADWYVVDAAGKTLGRLASKLAIRLRGKHKPEYTPHVDVGDHIVVLNAEKIRVTGAKLDDKFYHHHTAGAPRAGDRIRGEGHAAQEHPGQKNVQKTARIRGRQAPARSPAAQGAGAIRGLYE